MSQALEVSAPSLTADLYVQVQTFYAKQMRLLDSLQIDKFAETFTEDGVVVHASRNERAEGREEMVAGMRAALPRYAGIAVRHWFDKLLVEPVDAETVNVSYYTLVSRTQVDGRVMFEPTFTVEDVLVWRDGTLFTKSRVIHRDTPVNPLVV